MMRGSAIGESLRALLVLVAVGFAVAMCMHSAGCAPSSGRVLSIVEEAEYTLPYSFALDACKEEAKKKPRPQQWEAYQQCEDMETRKLCERNPRMRAAWKRCLEVEQ